VVVVENQVFFIFLGISLIEHNNFVLLCALCSLQARCCNGCGRRANQLGEAAGMLTHLSTLCRLLVYDFVALVEMGARHLSLDKCLGVLLLTISFEKETRIGPEVAVSA
jgi:hypothetical protein